MEAFNGGSHATFAHELLKRLPLNGQFYGLPSRHWRWRLQGSHIQLANWANENICDENGVFILTSLTDTAAFKGLLKGNLSHYPIITYMHENQMHYPINDSSHAIAMSSAKILSREITPGHHLNQALASDQLIFNSEFHKRSFYDELKNFLQRRDERELIKKIEKNSESWKVIPVGIDPPTINEDRNIDLLWNHRWDFDKNPKDFIGLCHSLLSSRPDLKIAIIGDEIKEGHLFTKFKDEYEQNISAFGKISKQDYWKILARSKVIPITSFHDFQGLSLLEAMSMGVTPIAPRRMVYPEQLKDLQELLYTSEADLLELTKFNLDQNKELVRQKVSQRGREFHWDCVISQWNDLLF